MRIARVMAVMVVAVGVLSAAGVAAGRAARMSVYAPANRCFALRAAREWFVVARGRSYASAPTRARATAFYLKPTGLGTYLLYDRGARLMSAGRETSVTRTAAAGPDAEFALAAAGSGAQFRLRSTARHRDVVARAGGGALALSRGRGTALTFVALGGCATFPEAGVDATVHGAGRRVVHGRIFGFIDDHLHITGNMRAGGDVISGEPFDRFGIPAALGQDAAIHGVDGRLDLTGNLLRSGLPIGTHDTHGWPTFTGWPTYNSMTHQQAYYVWLERAWRAGMHMVVAQTADDEPLCRLEPRRRTKTCSETVSVLAQIRVLKGLQGYVDAQSGGPGRGWFRLVYSPAQARRVMRAGKLAVMIGIESSDLFGCSLTSGGRAGCTRAGINRGLALYKRMGVRGMFVAHWVDNAFAGAALESGTKGVFINILNRFETGSYFETGACPGPGQGVTVTTLSQSLL